MPDTSMIPPREGASDQSVTVRYWAAARAAAGRESDLVESGSLAQVLDRVRGLHEGDERFEKVVSMCSILLGERPVGHADHDTVEVPPGATVELLPPFAGGEE